MIKIKPIKDGQDETEEKMKNKRKKEVGNHYFLYVYEIALEVKPATA